MDRGRGHVSQARLSLFKFFENNKDAYWLSDHDLKSIGKATRRLKTLGDSPIDYSRACIAGL